MALAAAGLGGALILAIGLWHVVSRHRVHEPPVIEADSRPLRVRPDNPGGLQVPGQDETIMGGTGSQEAEALAPPPETPAPQALRDQQQHPAQAAPAAPPVIEAPPQAAAPPAKPVPPPAAAKAAEKPQATGAVQVQLTAVDTEAAAHGEWQRISKRAPTLFQDRKPTIQKFDKNGQSLYRLRTGGFADAKQAGEFCAKVKAAGLTCTVANF